jgi:hypothetical protein
MTTLQKIVTAAKKLKKQHPNKYAKWTDYIKAAAKTVKPVAKKAVKKVGAVKTKKKAAPAKRKAAPAKRKAAPVTRHTDRGSHNVRIKVVSGVDMYTVRDRLEKQIQEHIEFVEYLKSLKKNKTITTDELKAIPRQIAYVKKLKAQLREQNKFINQSLR